MPGARVTVRALAERGIVEVESASRAGALQYPGIADGARDPLSDAIGGGDFELMPEQAAAIETIMPAVIDAREAAFLLWGVTASGKTEVYLKLAAAALEAGRQVLMLVPEIALADQIVRSFRARFGSLVAVAHSAQNVAERWASWMAALGGQARIMIGPRSAIFAPLQRTGADRGRRGARPGLQTGRRNSLQRARPRGGAGTACAMPGGAGLGDAVVASRSTTRGADAIGCCGWRAG